MKFQLIVFQDESSSLMQEGGENVCAFSQMSRDMLFPTMWHFDKCKLRRACAASF